MLIDDTNKGLAWEWKIYEGLKQAYIFEVVSEISKGRQWVEDQWTKAWCKIKSCVNSYELIKQQWIMQHEVKSNYWII